MASVIRFAELWKGKSDQNLVSADRTALRGWILSAAGSVVTIIVS
jgi:hypothetical protein